MFWAVDLPDRAAWAAERRKGIGGSDAAAIIGRHPSRSNVDLYLEKMGQAEPVDIGDRPYVRYGIAAEPLIRALFALDYPEYRVEYHENRILRCKEFPFLQASLDGELTDPEGRRGILEIKTSSPMTAAQWKKWDGRIPDHYYIQVLHYLIVTGYQFAVLRAHLTGTWEDGRDRRTFVRHYFIERSEVEEDLRWLLPRETRFWKYVEEGRRPPLVLPEL